MLIKNLPLANPSIKSFQYHAFQFAITDCYDITQDYKMSNYIQLFCDISKLKSRKNFHLDFHPCFQDYSFFNPYLVVEQYTKSFIDSQNINIMDVIMNAIGSNKYLWIYLDEFYIPRKSQYQKSHLHHDCLISGIDTTASTVVISGYDNSNQYNTWTISFKELTDAFYSTLSFKDDYDYFDKIFCLSFNPNYKYAFDVSVLYESLDEYLNCINSETHLSIRKNPNTTKPFGFSIYEHLTNYFNIVKQYKQHIDVIPVCILREHKVLMAQRLSFLEKSKYLLNEYSPKYYNGICKDSEYLMNLCIKYSISRDLNIINVIIEKINDICLLERKILQDVLGELSQFILSKQSF